MQSPNAPGPCRRPRVLLVDDEPALTHSLARAMHAEAFDVSTASSAAEALEYLRSHAVEVLVTDEAMPGMSGTELLRVVRDAYPSITRIMLSGTDDIETAARVVNGPGVHRLLLKPIPAEELAASIDAALVAREAGPSRLEAAARQSALSARNAAFTDLLSSLRHLYQPIFHCADTRPFGFETLVRGAVPGFESAEDLLREAAELGRTVELDRVIRARVARHVEHMEPGTVLLVNLHPESLSDEDLLDPDAPLSRHARNVVLEITERSALVIDAPLIERIARLRAAGYRLAIDDLGSGYSGLTCFAQLTPEFVKYDRELVHGAHASRAKQQLVASLNAVCRELGITTIAEGLEDPRDLECMRSAGCDLVQGFLLGRPAEHAECGGARVLDPRLAAARPD
ncbi:MAG: EAL domain-containing protein [Planctomycetes bacterium]|nr:EAL domain-containing protein [Planctomycetota bacterium]